MHVYGIDFGTCSTSISLSGNVLCNNDGHSTTPSFAQIQLVQVPYFKRLIGVSYSDFCDNIPLQSFFEQFQPAFFITSHPQQNSLSIYIPQTDSYFTVHQILVTFLSHFLNKIPQLPPRPINAVITVPAHFTPVGRHAVKLAFEEVGVNVLKILNEPTAAIYSVLNSIQSSKVCVLDCGGGTTDISIIDVTDGVFTVLDTWGDPFLGGNDLTFAILRYVLQGLHKKKTCELLQECIEAKHQLSTSFNVTSGPFAISRAKFIDITHSFWNTIKDIYNFETVLLVGGTTKTPHFKTILCDVCPSARVLCPQTPTCAVAIGASLYADSVISNTDHSSFDTVLIDILGYNLGIELDGGIMCPIISKLSSLPVSRTREFTNSTLDSNEIKINVYAGERHLVTDNHFITTCVLSYPPNYSQNTNEGISSGTLRILVSFSVDSNGMLNVTASDKTDKNITVLATNIPLVSLSNIPFNNESDNDLDDMDLKILDSQLMQTRLH
jgi:molecular chaperone HscA